MRQYHMVSGILLILSIIDSALAAPLLVQEKRQTCVDAVMLNIPKDVITVLAKRGEEEDIAMLAEKYMKKLAKSSASSSSAPPRPDLWSIDIPQAPPANWKHLMNIDYNPPPAPVRPPASEILDLTKVPMESKPMNQKHSMKIDHDPPPAPVQRPSEILDFTKLPMKSKPTEEKYWSSMILGNLLPKMKPPKDVGQAHEFQHGQQEGLLKNGKKPEESAGAHTPPEPDHGSTDVPQPPPADRKYLMNKDYPPSAPARPSSSKGPDFTGKHFPESMHEMEPPKGVGQAQESHGQQPNAGPGPSNAKPSNSRPTTTLDSSIGLGVKRPLPPPTDSERATMGYRPSPPPADPDLRLSPSLTSTEADSYRDPGSAVNPPSPGAWPSTIPEHGVVGTPSPPPKGPEDATPGSPTDPKL